MVCGYNTGKWKSSVHFNFVTSNSCENTVNNEKIVVIHQPDFLPYIGFFHRLVQSDLYVVLDNVQFLKGSRRWHNRDKIKTSQGAAWITVGVKKTSQKTNITDILLDTTVDWKSKNLNRIKESYKNAKYFDEIFPYLKSLYDFECSKLIDFNLKSITMLMELFDVRIEMVMASTLNVASKSNALLVDILQKTQATKYLSGVGAKAYYNPAPFEAANIEVVWQNFKHPVYPQLYGGFVPYLSSVDLFFNCGIETSREILRDC